MSLLRGVGGEVKEALRAKREHVERSEKPRACQAY